MIEIKMKVTGLSNGIYFVKGGNLPDIVMTLFMYTWNEYNYISSKIRFT